MRKSALGILIVLITGCSQLNIQASPTSESQQYQPLTELQIKQLVHKKQVNLLASRNIDNSTIILFQRRNGEIGYYQESFATKSGDFAGVGQSGSGNKSTPVEVIVNGNWSVGGKLVSATPFITLVINDKQLQQQAEKVTVVWNNDYQATELVNNRRGLIVPNTSTRDSTQKYKSVTFYDRTGKAIFKKVNESSSVQ